MLKAIEPGDIAIIGYACRLPGAEGPEAFRRLMEEGRSAIRPLQPGRFPKDRWGGGGPGRSYVWAAGQLEDPYAFDPGFFGISPREAEQMDPQQRLLLELAWEAMEHARKPLSTLGKDRAGVFIGAAGSDHSNRFYLDPGAIGANFMTGNTLSILSNRISYAFDLQGPSWTVDTACSSGLYALRAAAQELASGRIDAAFVGAVNMLLSPWPFAGFSAAAMLSPRGRCAAFDAEGDGYVRAEGAVMFLLRPLAAALADGDEVLGVIAHVGVNADGRTAGISLPSAHRQRALLEEVYGELGLAPDRLGFVEAHGTGTRAGDPQEAQALGEALGRRRAAPLPIGSAKTNVGHLEAGAGLVGLLKAQLALEHGLLPRSLHFETPNPDIDFAGLNLTVARDPVAVPRGGAPVWAGVNSFGFGGANAHAVLRQPAAGERRRPGRAAPTPLILSARSEESLRALAAAARDRLREDPAAGPALAAACAHGRERLGLRLVAPQKDPEAQAAALDAWLAGAEAAPVEEGRAADPAPEEGEGVLFLFSGNGGQHAGMGRSAHRADPAFRDGFAETAAHVRDAGGPDLTEALFAEDLAPRLRATALAQPLILAIQVGAVRALAARGIRPAATLGHSVGEVGAAWAAGAFSLQDAARLIVARSAAQEEMRGRGSMAALGAGVEEAEALIAASGIGGLCIAADNAGRATTLSGPVAAIEAFCVFAREKRAATKRLDLDYPFHSDAAEGLEKPLEAALGFLAPEETAIPFLSSVFGRRADGQELGPRYWWSNIRRPVRFREGLAAALARRPAAMLELGPRPVLLGFAREEIRAAGARIAALPTLEAERESDFDRIAARALAHGAPVEEARFFGPDPRVATHPPRYPWRRRRFEAPGTPEALGGFETTPAAPLLGRRDRADGCEWRAALSETRPAWLGDHRVAGAALLPAAGLAEIALSAAREGLPPEALQGGIELRDLDILRPLSLSEGEMELRTRLGAEGRVEIAARRRLSSDPFALVARATVRGLHAPAPAPDPAPPPQGGADALYQAAAGMEIDYGPAFRRATGYAHVGEGLARVALDPEGYAPEADPARFALHPALFDAALHGALGLLAAEGDGARHLPVRIGALSLHRPGAAPRSAEIEILRRSDHGASARLVLRDAAGEAIACVEGLRLRRAAAREDGAPWLAQALVPAGPAPADLGPLVDAALAGPRPSPPEPDDGTLLLSAAARRAAWEAMRSVAGDGGALAPEPLVAAGRLHPEAAPLWRRCLVALGDPPRLGPCAAPPAAALAEALLAEAPTRGAEILEVSGLRARLEDAFAEGPAAPPAPGADALAEEARRPAQAALRDALEAALRALRARIAPDARLAVAILGRPSPGLLAAARALGETRLDDPCPRRARALAAEAGTPAAGPVDLVIGCDALHRGGAAAARAMLRPGGAALFAEAAPDLAEDLFRGAAGEWLDEAGRGPRRAAPGILVALRAEGLAAEAATGGVIRAHLAAAGAGPTARAAPRPVALPGAEADAEALAAALARGGIAPAPGAALLLPTDPGVPALDAVAALAEALRIRALDGEGALHVLLRAGAAAGMGARPLSPRDAALRAFLRVAANERPERVIHVLDIGAAPDWDAVAAALAAAQDGERERVLTPDGLFALRLQPGEGPAPDAALSRAAAQGEGVAMRLARGRPGALDRLAWRPAPRRAPGPGEVEIEIHAAGLNFRDLMWAQGLLPDEALEDGFAGPGLGMECAGRVLRAGEGAGFAPGEPVIAFAPEAFATHATVPAAAVVPAPAGVPPEAAATIPVAFLTAWHGLIGLAQLSRGETALIHGGAGGVGLAAVQVALAAGAEVHASAGTPARRALLRDLGCAHVHDSRDLGFAEAVLRATGGRGVDVALNALSGEAMLRTLDCLAPFGRFVELGKRDYYGGGAMGLRPFRRNLSYFGVDVDQLLNGRPAAAARAMRAIAEGLARGDYLPLPRAVFAAEEAAEAFRLMQRSGQLGKIVLRPPQVPAIPTGQALPDGGAALILGGTGGLGAALAARLARRGMRDLWLVSRSGTPAAGAAEALAGAEAAGARLHLRALDVADPAAMEALMAEIRADGAPLRAVVHAAAALDDGLLAGQDEARMRAAMAAKIAGAEALDRLTREGPPEVFALFSSVSAAIGNPGQGAYAAANAYLEALAAERRRAGRPALAIAFGPVRDAGMLARDDEAARRAKARLGTAAITAAEALDALETALAAGAGAPGADPAAPVAARLDWGLARRELAVFATRYAEAIPVPPAGAPEGAAALRAMLAGLPEAEAAEKVAALLAAEACRILRLPPEELDAARPLADLGFDSLMAMDLRLAAEEALGVDIPLMSASGGASLNDLAAKAAERLRDPAPQQEEASSDVRRLAALHGGAAEALVRAADRHAALAERALD